MNGRLGQVVESPGQLWGEIVDSNYRRRFDHQIPEFHSASSTFGRSGQQSPGNEIEPPILGAVRFCQTQTEQVKPEPLDLDPPGTVGLTILSDERPDEPGKPVEIVFAECAGVPPIRQFYALNRTDAAGPLEIPPILD